jgi:hypothetical protein
MENMSVTSETKLSRVLSDMPMPTIIDSSRLRRMLSL